MQSQIVLKGVNIFGTELSRNVRAAAFVHMAIMPAPKLT